MGSRIERLDTGVAIVGAGPAGVAAAVRAAESGAQVIVIDDNEGPGGQIWRGAHLKSPDSQSSEWLRRFREAQIRTMTGAQVVSTGTSSRTLLIESSDGVQELQFGSLILATGSRELFLPFPGWTLPGIMGAGGLQALVKSGLPVAGKRIVVGGSGPLLLAVAAYLKKRGARVILIAEQAGRDALTKFAWRLGRYASKGKQAAVLRLSLLRVPYKLGCWVEAANGGSRLNSLQIRQGTHRWTVECEYAGIAYGLYPNTELAELLGCQILHDSATVDDWQQTSNPDILCAGELTGIGGVDLALVEGEIAGLVAAGRREEASGLFQKRRSARRFAQCLNETFALRPELKMLPSVDTLVCRCEDVPHGKLLNFPSFRAAKLHTRCGMGPCQGRVCGPATRFLMGWHNESVRPPILPARISSLIALEDE
jgi:D-hydroxyproline dehydrogenase subunit alpha